MSGSLNKVMIIGRLGADPELRYTPSSIPVASIRVATNFTWTTPNGEKKERVEWHRIIAWRKLAEIATEYLSKGRQTYIEGMLQTRIWKDKNNLDHYTTEIIAQSIIFLGDAPSKTQGKQTVKAGTKVEAEPEVVGAPPDVSPFDEGESVTTPVEAAVVGQ